MEKITILITDDHTLVRETWSFILNADERLKVVAECGTGEEAVERAKDLAPDVVIMDINLPGIDGFEATRLIRKFSPGSKVLAVSLHKQPAYVRKMLHEGAMGYVTKNSTCDEMISAIIEVQNNRRYICKEVKEILSEQVIGDSEPPNRFNSLSGREIEVIKFVKQGLSSKEIALEMGLSIKTVEVHRYNILKKLNLKNTAAMVNFINNNLLGATY
jgi:two-component system invasion response regulator UvrY